LFACQYYIIIYTKYTYLFLWDVIITIFDNTVLQLCGSPVDVYVCFVTKKIVNSEIWNVNFLESKTSAVAFLVTCWLLSRSIVTRKV
jgi:hypothetical protein